MSSAGADGRVVADPFTPKSVRSLPLPRSLVVRMDVTNRCNLDCIHCTLARNRESSGDPELDMPPALFSRIAREVFPFARVVALSCMAEPTIHRRFDEILAVVAASPGPSFMMTTNGTTLTPRRIESLMDSGIGGITLSLDGATSETFDRIRPSGRFDRVLRGLEALVAAKSRRGLGPDAAPVIQVNATLMRSTLAEMPALVELCGSRGVARLTLQHLYHLDANGLASESLVSLLAQSDEVLSRCRELCATYGIEPNFPRAFQESCAALPADAGGPSCRAPWQMLRIWHDGRLQPCDLFGDGSVGTLASASFEELWTGPIGDLRAHHLARRPEHSTCRRCQATTTDNLEGRASRSRLPFSVVPPVAAFLPLEESVAHGDPEAPARMRAMVASDPGVDLSRLQDLSGVPFFLQLAGAAGAATTPSIVGGCAVVCRAGGAPAAGLLQRFVQLAPGAVSDEELELVLLTVARRALERGDARWAEECLATLAAARGSCLGDPGDPDHGALLGSCRSASAASTLGAIHVHHGRWAEATASFRRSLELASRPEEVENARASLDWVERLIATGRFPGTLGWFADAAELLLAGDPAAARYLPAELRKVSGKALATRLANMAREERTPVVAGAAAAVGRAAGHSALDLLALCTELAPGRIDPADAEQFHVVLAYRAAIGGDREWASANLRVLQTTLARGASLDASTPGVPSAASAALTVAGCRTVHSLLMMGAVLRFLGDFSGATLCYRAYLERAQDAPDAADVRTLLEALAAEGAGAGGDGPGSTVLPGPSASLASRIGRRLRRAFGDPSGGRTTEPGESLTRPRR